MKKQKSRISFIVPLIVLAMNYSVVNVTANDAGQCIQESFLTLPTISEYRVTSWFHDPLNPAHIGTDYSTPNKTPIVAMADGLITAKWVGSYGLIGYIDHGSGIETRYAHLSSLGAGIVRNREPVWVLRGQVIGYSGTSGGPWLQADGKRRDAYHLHMEVRINGVAVDPYASDAWLWKTNPPTTEYKNKHFSFPNHNPQNWLCSNDASVSFNYGLDHDTFQVITQGSNPGIASPVIEEGKYTCNQFSILQFSAKVRGDARAAYGHIWVEDNHGTWQEVSIITVDGINTNIVPIDYEYHVYTVDLSRLGNTRLNRIIIQLTQNIGYEEWIFDWIEVRSGINQNVEAASLDSSYDGQGGASEQPTPTPTPTLGSSQSSNPFMDCQGSGVWGTVSNISNVGSWEKLNDNSFPALSQFAYAADLNGNILLYGGWKTENNRNVYSYDTWYYNGSNWNKVTPPSNRNVSPRSQTAICYDQGRHEFILAGGDNPYSDTKSG